jgi:hypothetical protein
MTDIVYGNVAHPGFEKMIVTKAFDGAGYNSVPARTVLGVCDHCTAGLGTIEWYHEFFSVGGQRADDALVDFIIDKRGRAAMFNDPFGTRMPWASGGSDGLEGDGPAFVASRGIFGINGELVSKEHVAGPVDPMTDAQMEMSAKITAFYFDGANNHARCTKVPYDQFPYNPNKGVECVTAMQHFEFATKPCPGAGIRGQTDAYQELVRSIMKAAQTAQPAPPPNPDPQPAPQPRPIKYPSGYNLAIAKKAFGTGRVHRPKKASAGFGFHEDSAVSLAWLSRCAKEKLAADKAPRAVVWHQDTDITASYVEIVVFEFTDRSTWTLFRPSSRASYTWMKD